MDDSTGPETEQGADPITSSPPTLAALVGEWETRGQVLGEDGRTVVGGIEGTDRYAWLGPTVVHTADVVMAGRRTRSLEVVEPWDAGRAAFPTRAYDDQGGAESSTATVDGDGVWSFHAAGARAVLRVAADGASMEGTWTVPTDDGERPWLLMTWRRLA